ncbi:MAG: Crp/Fnr family transcriptional regulator [Alphaproteobacteria bacterium]|nr:Crp/Fnr family transcriptional regulator [Alphaproteobacteria bacterium]
MAAGDVRGLEHVPFFSTLSPSQREDVVKSCRWKRYAPQEQIIDRQSNSRDIYFVVEGQVRIIIYSLGGREVTLADLCAGEYFGELSAIDGEPRSASVVALEATTLAIMSPEQFVRLVSQHPDLALDVMRRLTSIVRHATKRIMELSTLGANNRVHADLLRRARAAQPDENGRPVLSPIPVHSDIASRVSTTRETVARVLNDLARGEIVRRERDALVFLDIERLEDMVEEVSGE